MDFFELRDWVCAHSVRLPGELHQGHSGTIEDETGLHWKKGRVLQPSRENGKVVQPSELATQLAKGARFFVVLGYDYPPWAINAGCELNYLNLMQSEWADPTEWPPQAPGDSLAFELSLAGKSRHTTRTQNRQRLRAVLITDGYD